MARRIVYIIECKLPGRRAWEPTALEHEFRREEADKTAEWWAKDSQCKYRVVAYAPRPAK